MYKIFVSKHFKKQLKKLVKKDSGLKKMLIDELKSFNKNAAISIGRGVFKIRLKRRGEGKSGGYRLYVFVMEIEGILTPVSIYAKSDRENLSKAELSEHLELVRIEVEEIFD